MALVTKLVLEPVFMKLYKWRCLECLLYFIHLMQIVEDKMLYVIPCSTALQLCVDYSLRDRCIVFIQEVSVSSCITYEIIDKYDKNFNAFPQVRVVWLWHVRHLSMTIITFIHLRIIDSSKSVWYKSLNLYQSIL